MLIALIAFIWLGTCLIDVVKITSYPSSARYDCDFVARITNLTDDEAEAELERCLAIDGITDGMLMRVTANTHLAYTDGTIVGANIADAVIQTVALEKGEDIRYCVEVPISDEVVRRFDELLAEGGHPVIVTRHVADKYRFAVGSTLTIIADTVLGQRRLVNDFTVVGIDETATSWDDIVFISATDIAAEDVGTLPCSYRMQLNGDTSRFAELREQVDTENVTFYTREGYFPAESAASVDDSDKMLSVFSVIIYIIAAMGLANLVVINRGGKTAGAGHPAPCGHDAAGRGESRHCRDRAALPLRLCGGSRPRLPSPMRPPSPSRRSRTATSSSTPSLSGCSPSRG